MSNIKIIKKVFLSVLACFTLSFNLHLILENNNTKTCSTVIINHFKDERDSNSTSTFYKVCFAYDIPEYINYTGNEYDGQDNYDELEELRFYFKKICAEINETLKYYIKQNGTELAYVEGAPNTPLKIAYFYTQYNTISLDLDSLFELIKLPFITSIQVGIIETEHLPYAVGDSVHWYWK